MTSTDREGIDLLVHDFNADIGPLDPDNFLEPTTVPGVRPEVVAGCGVALRRIRSDRGGSLEQLAVTSSVRREGRSTVALGAALVQRNEYGQPTILVELDLESKSQVVNAPGIAEVMRGQATLAQCIVPLAPHLGLLPSGNAGDEAGKLLARFRSSTVLHDLRHNGYAVVADLPPLPPFGLADRVADLFSGVLLVVRAGKTPVEVIRAAIDRLDEPPAILLNAKTSAVPRWLRPMVGG
jgi:Mrp family chromosome partitioning ATPase